MKNERGEVVTGVMVLMMAGMMIFGLFFTHGMHGGRGDHRAGDCNQQVQHSDSDHRHMHDSAAEKDSVPAEDGNK